MTNYIVRSSGQTDFMTEHKIGMLMGENRAFIERIAWYCVGVVNLLSDVNHQEKTMADTFGSGTACTWEGHRLILTAKHVIVEAKPDDLAFLLRVDDAINWEGTDKEEKVISRISLPIERIVRCKEHDLAAIVLRANELAGFRMQFCELPKQLAKDRTIKRQGSLFLIGYPADQIFTISKEQIANTEAYYHAVRPTILTGTIAKPSNKLSSEYDPERDVLLHYEPNDPKMKPKGFSGAAVWRERVRAGGVWTADPVVFGLQTSWFSTSRLLQVLGAPTIKNFLEESF